MTIPIRIALAAPLALAACGDTTEVDDRVVETAEKTPVDVSLPNIPSEYPVVPADARNTLDYAGSYELHDRNGGVSTITLDDSGSYTWRGPDGVETTGSFTWGDDGSRIVITRDGETNAFAVAEDVLYRLPAEDASLAGERSEETTWRRSDPASADGNRADRPGE